MCVSWLRLSLLLECAYFICHKCDVKVQVNNYEIYGNRHESSDSTGLEVHEYLGIPFAKPPLGALRFAPPQALDDDDDESRTIQARTRSKTCWQPLPSAFEKNNAGARVWYNNTEMSEDCLYLNVWTPATLSGELLPVMVWIFGGGFFTGSANIEFYNGRFLAGREKVVVVSMQYRLGALGFLCLEGAKESEQRLAACNMGLQDQQMALKWMRKNIAAFGGDPDRVTLFGDAAGSASVGLHYLSPESRPLFSQMIMQSGSVFNRWALVEPKVAYEGSAAFSKICGCTEESLEKRVKCLQNLQPAVLASKSDKMFIARAKRRSARLTQMTPPLDPRVYTYPAIYASHGLPPTIDGVFLPKCPEAILAELAANQSAKSPSPPAPKLLIGTVANEGMYWLFYALGLKNVAFRLENGTVPLPDAATLKAANFNIYDLLTGKFMSEQNLDNNIHDIVRSSMADAYGIKDTDSEVANSSAFMHRMDAISGDIEFTCGTQKFAQRIAQLPNTAVYAYNFVHKTRENGFPDWTGAMHGYQIDYIFGMPFSAQFERDFYKYTEAEAGLSATVMAYWANFARTGNPTQKAGDVKMTPDWPAYDVESGYYMEIGLKQTVKTNYRSQQCNFWNKLLPSKIKEHLSTEGRGVPNAFCPNLEPYLYEPEPLPKFVG